MNIAVIGCGKWGSNYLRVLNELNIPFGAYDPAFTDTAFASLTDAAEWCDAAIVATPASTHAEITLQLLEMGKHVLVEKPMATSSDDAQLMLDTANNNGLRLMVSSPFLYRTLPDQRSTLMGKEFLCCQWFNQGGSRPDVSVVWDLAPHPVAICNHLMFQTATKARYHGHRSEGVLVVEYENPPWRQREDSFTLFVECSWSRKRRRIFGNWNFDDYDKDPEPLACQIEDFLDAIEGAYRLELGTAQQGVEVVKVLEMAGC